MFCSIRHGECFAEEDMVNRGCFSVDKRENHFLYFLERMLGESLCNGLASHKVWKYFNINIDNICDIAWFQIHVCYRFIVYNIVPPISSM